MGTGRNRLVIKLLSLTPHTPFPLALLKYAGMEYSVTSAEQDTQRKWSGKLVSKCKRAFLVPSSLANKIKALQITLKLVFP